MAPPPPDLECSTPHPHDLDYVKSRPRKLHPNFFLKATLLTFDDFKERFRRVHGDLLEKSEGRVDGLATRGTCSACETNSQKGDHTSIRSKSSTSISRSITSLKCTTLSSSKYSIETCLRDGDKHTKETREKHSVPNGVVLTRKACSYDCKMPSMGTSTGHAKYPESNNSQSESAFKTVDADLKGRSSKYSKSLTCKLGGHRPTHKDCRTPPTSESIDMTKERIRRIDSVDSGKKVKPTPKLSNFTKRCLDATKYKGVVYEVCENGCKICNTSAVIDHASGNLKRADSDRVHRPKKKCLRICSETSVIRSCIRVKKSEVGNTVIKEPPDELIDESETCSRVSECERCSQTRRVQRSYVEDVVPEDNHYVLASKAKMYGFNYEDICDLSDPVNEFVNHDECVDDLTHLNRGRYSNHKIDNTKMMMIRKQNTTKRIGGRGAGFTYRGRVSNILKPLEIIIRYFPVPPVNIIFENKSPLDVLFRSEELNEPYEKKHVIDEDLSVTDDSIGEVSVPTSIILDKEDSHNSFWMGDSASSLSSHSLTITTSDENVCDEESSASIGTSDVTQTEHGLPITVPPTEKSFILSVGQLGNYAHCGSIMKRNKSEPSIANYQNKGYTLKKSVSDLMNVPSRFIPIRDYECIEPTRQLRVDTTLVRLTSLGLFIYAGCLLGYPTLILYLFDMFFGPDFSSIIYVVIGIIIAYAYMQCMNYVKSVWNNKQIKCILPKQNLMSKK